MACRKREAKTKAIIEEMANPIALFDLWLAEARKLEVNDPEAMALATSDSAGNPSVRMVLLKGHGPQGFVFYTNEGSAKGRQLAENPSAALLFHWKSLRRQVRIEGRIEPVPDEVADAYFATRSRDSQVGAWASDQSRALENRELFEARYADTKAKFEGGPVPRPPHWRGYRLVPNGFEFWEDRPHRLHQRTVFLAKPDGGWSKGLLYP